MERTGSAWGALPVICLFVSYGLVLLAIADSLARAANPSSDLMFWAAIAMIVGPVAVRLLAPDAHRAERLGLVIAVAIATYLAKILHSPAYFTLFDEAMHSRTAADISESGQLFLQNPLLVVSPLYPGLELVTTAVSQLASVSIFDAGVAVVAVARLLFAGALFVLFEDVAGSSRVAGIAGFIYATNPNFIFFNSQYAYESLALPLAVLAIVAAIRWQRSRSRPGAYASVALVSIAAVIVTHHLTSFVLIAFLGTWIVLTRLVGPRRAWRVPALAFTFALTGTVAWLLLVAAETIRYMAPRVRDSLELFRLILGQSVQRPIFQTSTGVTAPEWERVTAFLSVGLLLALLPFGIWQIWKGHRRDAVALTLAVGALGYPASLALRLTRQGAEESTRVPEFVFLGLAFVGALVVSRITVGAQLRPRRPTQGVVAMLGVVVFFGGLIIGLPAWARLPGPYLPAADPRSIEPAGRAAAAWALEFLGPGTRIATDRINRNLMGSEGRQDPVTAYGDQIDTWRLFYSTAVDDAVREIVRQGRIRVIITDDRLTTALPLTRVYYESGEPGLFNRRAPLDPQYLAKWNSVPDVSRFFDSGAIKMFDVSSISDAD